MVMVAMVAAHRVCQVARHAGAVLAGRLQVILQLGERALRRTQASRLESLAKRLEVFGNRAAARRRRLLGALGLSPEQLLQGRVRLLRATQVSRLERTGQLLEVLHDLLAAALALHLRRSVTRRDR